MTTLFFVLEVGLVAGLVFTPVARSLAARLGLVDRPDGRRKVHARVTPLAGGPALLAASALAVGAAFAPPGPAREQLQREWSRLVGLALAGGLICALGVADGYSVMFRSPSRLAADFAGMRSAGARWVRFDLWWGAVEPRPLAPIQTPRTTTQSSAG